jgi:hypothetical protein
MLHAHISTQRSIHATNLSTSIGASGEPNSVRLRFLFAQGGAVALAEASSKQPSRCMDAAEDAVAESSAGAAIDDDEDRHVAFGPGQLGVNTPGKRTERSEIFTNKIVRRLRGKDSPGQT